MAYQETSSMTARALFCGEFIGKQGTPDDVVFLYFHVELVGFEGGALDALKGFN
jgi:hypothetical protein